MSYSIDALTSGCYEGTSCLINKFDVKDESVLKELETTITLTKTTEYFLNPLFSTFDVQHYRNIHKYLFGDIYEWAGEYRSVDKKITAMFCTSKLVEGVNLPADNLFIKSYYSGRAQMTDVDSRNLIGRVGRIQYNLSGDVFMISDEMKREITSRMYILIS